MGASDDLTDLRLPREAAGREPQSLLMTLLGDYWGGRHELLPSSVLVDLLGEFGISEVSARQAVRRLRGRNLLVQEKAGRQTFYGTPPEVARLAVERRLRVLRFGLDVTDWDERWTVVAFSVPESDRDVRRQVRHRLGELMFGMLQDALWVSPYDHVKAVISILDELGVRDAHVMRSEMFARPGHEDSIAQAFDLESLDLRYREHAAHYEPVAERVGRGGLTPSEALTLRTEAMSAWLRFRRVDPDLPAQILPGEWGRHRARNVTYAIYDELGAAAEARFREIIARADPKLARLTRHHTSRDG